MAAAAWAAWTAVALSAESARKGHVQQGINEDRQDAEIKKAEQKSKAQESRKAAIRQQEAMRGKRRQQEAVTKSPFANKRKGTMRKQFTVGGGGSGSGTNY